jgi:uncharacterized repeat protein (TIGR04138 family)
MATTQPDTDWKTLLAAAGPYPLEAFAFVRDGLSHTVSRVHQAADEAEANGDEGPAGESSAETAAETSGAGTSAAGAGSRMVGRMQSDSRHVSGQQLCLGLRDYAIKRYGMMAPAVLRAWNLRATDDFGRIVFAMIDHGLMSKTADDSLEDFRSVYDFDEAFAREELLRHVGRS